MTCRILLVDTRGALCAKIREVLPEEGFDVRQVVDPRELPRSVRRLRPDVVVLDPASSTSELAEQLAEARTDGPDSPVVLILGSEQVASLVSLTGFHARDVYPRRIPWHELSPAILGAHAAGRSRRRERSAAIREQRLEVDPFLGDSTAIRALELEAVLAAESAAPLLIVGETGAGKGVLARWVHRNGPRSRETFVDLNCAGLSRELLESELFGHSRGAFTGAVAAKQGLLEVADHGTLLLDEVADMDAAVQPKLLTVLEERWLRRLGEVAEREVDVRVIAACSRDLAPLVEAGSFRAELYYRISTLVLRCPPLRERPGDIPPLADSILRHLGSELGRRVTVASAALDALISYSWPGNIRELRNVLERALLHSSEPMITAEDLDFSDRRPRSAAGGIEPPDATLEEVQRLHIDGVLRQVRGHVESAARRLGVPRSTLYQKIKTYGLRLESYRQTP